MGLTNRSTGSALFALNKTDTQSAARVALAGNPNVGKSTIFNALTGMKQHTGNWPGKTIANATGVCNSEKRSYTLVDIPGTYSLFAHSAEEEIARNYICFGKPDIALVVCDGTCLERNLNLVLQTLEIQKNTIVCVNLLDEAKRKNIEIDIPKLSQSLGVPVIGISARNKKDTAQVLHALDNFFINAREASPFIVHYVDEIENAISELEPIVKKYTDNKINSRWLSLQLLAPDISLLSESERFFGFNIIDIPEVKEILHKVKIQLLECGYNDNVLRDSVATSVICAAESIAKNTVTYSNQKYNELDRKIDKILTGKLIGYPVMLLFLALIFWITITAASYPSEKLNAFFSFLGKQADSLFITLSAPEWLRGIVIDGMLKVLFWVVAVMLPPMAIFFPFFTLLEDIGYLPRIAYNLDGPFKKCKACGKQALTMCMGFGCNAAGIVGCRIIDSPRERLLAILTNTFVPCNGRFPTLIALISIFFIGGQKGFGSSILSAIMLTGIILIGVFATLLITRLLSDTVLKGLPSSFTLEMPPYRKPQIGSIIVRSIFDRTLFVLGRAVSVAAPAGIVIWLMANITISGSTLLSLCAGFLDPFARLIGLDGIILMAFILGFPANEIVIPITVMAYLAEGHLSEIGGISAIRDILLQNGWTPITAICVIVFSLMHWPCSTTLLTIKKETGSLKWTAAAAIIPTACGMLLCFLINQISKLFL